MSPTACQKLIGCNPKMSGISKFHNCSTACPNPAITINTNMRNANPFAIHFGFIFPFLTFR